MLVASDHSQLLKVRPSAALPTLPREAPPCYVPHALSSRRRRCHRKRGRAEARYGVCASSVQWRRCVQQDASQALLDVDTVFADKALDAMFAPSAAAASASAPAQLPAGAWANASTPSVTHQCAAHAARPARACVRAGAGSSAMLCDARCRLVVCAGRVLTARRVCRLSSASDSQVHCARGQPGLARNWPHAAHGGAPAGAGAPVGMLPTTAALRTHLTSGPPPMVASSYPAAPQVFDAPLDGTPGMGVQHPVARAPAWAHGVASEAPARSRSVKRDSRGEAKPRSGSEGSNDRARLSDVGGHAAAQLPYGWLPLDHPGAEAQRLHAAHAARDAALQMQRQAAMYPAMAPPYMAVPQNAPPQHAQRPQMAPGTYSCPPLGAVNVARAHYPAAVPISNAPNWQHVGLHSSSMSTQSIPHQDAGLNAAFDYAMAAAAHTASPPPLKRVASESAPGSFVVRHAGAVSPGAGGPPRQ